MIDTTAQNLRDDYLARLDAAMRGVPHGIAAEIREGVAEELHGLDADATRERIARLGDPARIAREALDEDAGVGARPAPVAAPIPAVIAARPATTTTRGFAIAAALTLSFGGIVVPIVGWFVGAVLVSLSPLWKTGEKVVAIVVPFVTAVISSVLIGWASFSVTSSSGSSSSGSSVVTEMNPLVPAWYDIFWLVVMALGVILVPLSGLWLLWRLRGRTSR